MGRVDVLEFDYAVKRAGFNRALIAEKLGISKTALSNKLRGKSEFKLSEMQLLYRLLDLKGIGKLEPIFFN